MRALTIEQLHERITRTNAKLSRYIVELHAANVKLAKVRAHCTGEPSGRSDEDIPDEDKCAAHEMGYVDAQANILAILTEPEGGQDDT